MADKNIYTNKTFTQPSSWCASIFGPQSSVCRYSKELAIGAIAALALGGAYYGYRWYNAGQEEVAQRMFAQNVQEYDRAVQEGKKEDWASIEAIFKLGYSQYSGSSLAPYFLVYQAQALIKQDKMQEAKEVLDKAVSSMSSSSPLQPLYAMKLALMTMDTDAKAGIDQLQTLANDSSNKFSDAAAYYLGEYYWTHNEGGKAKEVWQKMIETTKTDKKLGQSPWAAMAQTTLEQVA